MRRILLGALLAAAPAIALAADDAKTWEPAPSTLKTRWAAQVDPATVHSEYPRPQLVREKWTNLNGLWDHAVRPTADARPDVFDGPILVPFPIESALSGVKKGVKPDETLWYRRTFALEEPAAGTRFLLHFGAVDWAATVTVNGKEVGSHKGGYDPFSFDVTDALDFGKPGQEIVVAVTDPTDQGGQPRGKQVLKPEGIWYTPVTGIWQTVWLEPVPAARIDSLKIVPDVDAGEVHVTPTVVGGEPGEAVRVLVFDGDDVIAEGTGPAGEPIKIAIAEPKLWGPDSPFLYDLKATLGAGDAVGSYFGMRKIELGKDEAGVVRLMLNDRPLFQYGPLDQGWWPDGLYTAPTDEALKYDLDVTKQLNFNMIRKHVKVEPARWYRYCDEMGLLVWQDMPSGDNKTDADHEQFDVEWKAVVDALHNHPSIVMWVPFNEGWGQHDTERVVAWTKDYDPTRIVNNASGWTDKGVGDVNDMHNYPGPGMPALEENRAAVLGEFGGLGLPIEGHVLLEKGNWGYVSFKSPEELGERYLGLVDRLKVLAGLGLSAAVYTQTTDVEIEVNGFMTYDREVMKFPVDAVAQAHAALYDVAAPLRANVLIPTAQTAPQEWKYTTDDVAAEGWNQPDFDDSGWASGLSGFGTKETPNTVVNTEWTTPEIRIRKEIDLAEAPTGQIWLSIHHDDEAEIFLNGQSVAKLGRWVSNYELVPLGPDAAQALKAGRNVIAVSCRQDKGGQYIDVGVIEVKQANP
ncbi:glycoside hydrolase family 2 protein [Planctomyces sp. SH-PL62]|uniref:glycoside hydrolase family 2 protein n=1 Tax=Planctomyces sp. SH-PL62 TaxID=1636152 RepID=UPI00078BC552|nr:sugar-binding domain-containing protein [Planctomyces sp. SH-PL62]AMV38187.1 Beta-galactosidase [Planctomyces sp. SH-PL62]